MAWLAAAWRWRKAIAIGLMALGVIWGLWKVYSWGYAAHSIKVERSNANAGKQGVEGARDVRSCADRGRVWDSAASKCLRPEPGD